MKHWRALSRGTRIYYLVTMLLPLAEASPFLISFVGRMIRGHVIPPLEGPAWVWLALPAPGILLGAVSLVRAWAGHPPRDPDIWDFLLLFTYIPDLFLLAPDGLLLLHFLWIAFSGSQ